jgi:hypothetical protein
MKPFTYLLTHKKTGKRYYGVRYWKNADPSELWNTYFSSSQIIKRLVKEEGPEAFDAEVRKVFSSKEKALLWEQRFLTKVDAARNAMWFNRHNGGKNFHCTGHSKKTKRLLSQQRKGKPKTEEHKKKIAAKSTWVGKLSKEQIANRKIYRGDDWRSCVGRAAGVAKMRESKVGLRRVYREDGTFFMQRP